MNPKLLYHFNYENTSYYPESEWCNTTWDSRSQSKEHEVAVLFLHDAVYASPDIQVYAVQLMPWQENYQARMRDYKQIAKMLFEYDKVVSCNYLSNPSEIILKSFIIIFSYISPSCTSMISSGIVRDW